MSSLSPNPEASVLVVDDDVDIRRALERLLRFQGFRVESFESGARFMAREIPLTPCCLVLDLCMPDVDGLQVLETLKSQARQPPTIFISGQGDISSSVAAMKGGAVDFLEKPFETEPLLTAIEKALEQDRRQLAELRRRSELADRLATLTPRERELLPYVVQGLPNLRIAGVLAISEKTVKVHRARVFNKMGATSLPDLVRRSALLGIHGTEI